MGYGLISQSKSGPDLGPLFYWLHNRTVSNMDTYMLACMWACTVTAMARSDGGGAQREFHGGNQNGYGGRLIRPDFLLELINRSSGMQRWR